MKNIKMQSLMSLIRPPVGEEKLALYLSSATKALNAGSDAGLGRCIGVRPSTVANWKRRGAVAQEHISWFMNTLLEKIGTYSRHIHPQASLKSRTAVIQIIVRFDGNPLFGNRDGLQLTAIALPGLIALAQFLEERLEAERAEQEIRVEEITDMLEAAIADFRYGDNFRAYY